MTPFPPPSHPWRNERFALDPLRLDDFESLYSAAADPLIWAQHPEPNRHEREVFARYFEGALHSQSAYVIRRANSPQMLGCTRYYDYVPEVSVCIGYTFLVRELWGTDANAQIKRWMLDHAFHWVPQVFFHVGPDNLRSQRALLKIGAQRLPEFDTEDRLWFGIKKGDNNV